MKNHLLLTALSAATVLIGAVAMPALADPPWARMQNNGGGFFGGNGHGNAFGHMYGGRYHDGAPGWNKHHGGGFGGGCDDDDDDGFRGGSCGMGHGHGHQFGNSCNNNTWNGGRNWGNNWNAGGNWGNNWNNGQSGSGLLGRDARLYREDQRLSQLLSSGNLSPQQQQVMQNRLDNIRNREGLLNGSLNNQLDGRINYLKDLLSHGNLSSTQAHQVQDELIRMEDARDQLASGNPFGNGTGFLGGLRGMLGL